MVHAAGAAIALTGRTGSATTEHLHFETRINGQHVNSNRFFNHETHQLRPDAFKKAKKTKEIKKTKKTKKSKKNKRRGRKK